MAITKLWSRRKDENRASSSIVAETIEYACNQEKTKNLEVTLIDDEFIDDNDVMENVLKYVVKEDKTKIKNGEFAELEEVFVSGVNCRTETADDEFMQVKKYWNKTDKNLLWHGVQSFSPGEIDPKTAHEIGIKLANRMWGENFQVVVTTHCDKEHIHNHFVVNSVSFKNGKKYHYGYDELYRFRNESDKLCYEYGLSVIKNPKSRGVGYSEWANGGNGKTVRALIKEDIDEAIVYSNSIMEVFTYLEDNLGYEVNRRGKYITLKPPGRERTFRLENIDKNRKNPNAPNNYTVEAISKRLMYKNDSVINGNSIIKKQSYKKYHTLVKNNCFDALDYIFASRTIRGIYWHYFYLLNNPKTVKKHLPQSHFKIRREAQLKIKKYSERLKYVTAYKIDTVEDIEKRINFLKKELQSLVNEQSDLREKLQYKNSEALINEIELTNKSISDKRKELYLCSDIKKNYEKTDEELKSLENQNQQKQEERNNEQWQQKTKL